MRVGHWNNLSFRGELTKIIDRPMKVPWPLTSSKAPDYELLVVASSDYVCTGLQFVSDYPFALRSLVSGADERILT